MATKRLIAYKDTSVNNASPDSSYYGTATLNTCGCNNSSPPYKSRMFLGFDLSAIPAGSQITAATLNLRLMAYGGSDPYLTALAFDIYRVTGSWNEAAATWNNMPSVASSPFTGYVCEASATDVWRSYDIKTLIEEMILNGNDSIMIRDHTETTQRTQRGFYSREYSTSWCAYIDVTYIPPVKIAVVQGGVDKNVLKMMIAPDMGAVDKNIIRLEIVSGGNWKTAF